MNTSLLVIALLAGSYRDFGYSGVFSAAVVESRFGLLRGSLEFSPTDKYNGSGTAYRLGGGFFQPLRGGVSAGAGAEWAHLATHEWSKSVTRPFAEVRWDSPHGALWLRYRNGSLDRQNHLSGIDVGLDTMVWRKLGVRLEIKPAWYHDTDLPGSRRSGLAWRAGPIVAWGR